MKPKKLLTKNYTKKFETIEQMIIELSKLNTEFDDIFYPCNSEVDYDITTVLNCIENYFDDNRPDLKAGKNLPVFLSISANKAVLKTAKFFSFGWVFKYDRESGIISEITANVTVFLKHEADKNSKLVNETVENLDASWTYVENKK